MTLAYLLSKAKNRPQNETDFGGTVFMIYVPQEKSVNDAWQDPLWYQLFLLMMSTHVPAHLDSYVVVLKRRLAKYADLPDYKIYELYLKYVLILV